MGPPAGEGSERGAGAGLKPGGEVFVCLLKRHVVLNCDAEVEVREPFSVPHVLDRGDHGGGEAGLGVTLLRGAVRRGEVHGVAFRFVG